MSALILVHEKPLVAPDGRDDPFDQLVEATLATVAPKSARVYRQTFMLWQAW